MLALLIAPVRAELPHGEDIDDAIAADITAEGFVELPRIAGNLVPDAIPIPDVNIGDSQTECFIWCITLWEYNVDITGLDVGVGIDDLTMTPATDRIDVDASAKITLNSQAAPAQISAGVEIFEIIDIGTTCGLWVNPVNIDIGTSVGVDVLDVGGERVIDATVAPITWSWTADGSILQLSSCGLADIQDFFDGALFDIINFNPWELAVGLVLDTVEGTLDEPIQSLAAEIEPALEDAFAAAQIQEDIELGDTVLSVDVWPEDVVITPAGMRIQLGGALVADVHPCMDPYNPTASISSPGDLPPLASAPASIPSGHHLGILVDDDLINQALYSVWAGGLLCYTLEDGDDSLPVPMNTTLLGIVAGDAFNELFPETKPMVIHTRPRVQPFAVLGGDHDVTARIEDLGLDMYAELDGRMARMIGADIETDAGVDLGWVAATGELSVDITFDAEAVEPTVHYIEMAPQSASEVEEQLSGLMGVIVDPLVGDLLSDIRFGMPSLEGLGLQTLDYAPSGAQGDHIGLYADLGLVQYDNGGCDGEGCADSGADCGGGCAVGGASAPSRLVYASLLLLLVARRRR